MRIRKAVIPAAGLGTRFLPATKAQPKEMLSLVDKPVIQYVVEEAVSAGIDHIIIVVGQDKKTIEDHFNISHELEKTLKTRGKKELLHQIQKISNLAKISYVQQKEALGLGHAILVAKDLIGEEPFAVLLGDDLIDSSVPCTLQMVEVFKKFKSSILATQVVEGPDISRYGVIEPKSFDSLDKTEHVFEVSDLVEKPSFTNAPSNLAIIGRYILTEEIFDTLTTAKPDANGEIQLTQGLRLLLEKQAIHAYCFKGKRFDAGDKLGFLKATVELALKRKDLGEDFLNYLKKLPLFSNKSTQIRG